MVQKENGGAGRNSMLALNRLTTSSENSGASWSQTNVYDRYGNRQIDYGGGVYNLAFSSSTNRITTSGFGYDGAGNLTNDTIHAYTFDAENRISNVDNGSAYVYDGDGQRVKKLAGENTRFVYGIGGQLLAEFDGSTGNLKKEYVYGSSMITIEPTAMNSNGTQYSISDHLGSPRVVTNSGGSVSSRHDYMPFGEELGATVGGRTTGMGYSVADGLRQKFTQKERDNETGLDYFLARYYGSTQGRFTSPDPLSAPACAHPNVPQSWNLYTYVLNNPLNLTDPDGLMWIYRYLDDEHKRIGIAWIEGNKISRADKAQGYQALNFGGQSSRDVTLTNGSVVRLSATSGHPLELRGPQQSGSDGGYVNTGLIRELGRQTAPMPAATGAFILLSLNGGYAIAGSSLALLDAAAFSLNALHEQSENDAQVMATTSNSWEVKPNPRSNFTQVHTNATKSEFIQNLRDAGYKETRAGNAVIMDNGTNRYTVYDSPKNGPSAQYFRGGESNLKIRLNR